MIRFIFRRVKIQLTNIQYDELKISNKLNTYYQYGLVMGIKN